MDIISIIIPCYNYGHFIREAIESINVPSEFKYELIIVNDGSTDKNTIEVLKALEEEGFFVINQVNKGLSAARNVGIAAASGEFILPLDADNKLLPNYIPLAIKALKDNPDYSIAYGIGEYFGGKTGIKGTKPFTLHDLMTMNFIDACAVYRKSAWKDVGG